MSGRVAIARFTCSRSGRPRNPDRDDDNREHHVELPNSALRLLVDILAQGAECNAIKAASIHA
ncbi:hypothetical protein LGM90_10835 [Burkholderia sp. AU28942]|uniref:hypothetical protein n=1 Tax=Burkholderia TaxID=32008 RepID=UPI0008418998|nr:MULTISPECIES: hypothetical protein [Burkholderia]AOK07496.1 hypothetical protein WK25_23695 [Burkholderia latens]MCA8309004.1 hypothetical protein [Burkholderia sp. AU28942]